MRRTLPGNQPGGMRNVPRNSQFFREYIGSPRWQKRHRHVAARHAVHDFIDGAVATADNHHAAPLFDSLPRDFRGGREPLWAQARAIPESFKIRAALLYFAEAAMALVPAGWVVDQSRVFNSVGHSWSQIRRLRIV